jgi:anti-sigma factor RsiW
MRSFCWVVRRRLGAYQDGELSPRRRAGVEGHVHGCPRCAAELQALGRLRAALTLDVADPPEAVWTAFWPQVRTRLAAPAPAPGPVWRRSWDAVRARPSLGLAPALAVGVLAVLAVVAPWQPRPIRPDPAPVAGRPELPGSQQAALDHVIIQSIETDDPDVPVMVYASPESDVTVLWVFGLPRTDT